MLDGRKVEISTKEGFEPLPADKYTVQIVDVNIKTQLKYQSSEEEEVLEYKFQVLDDNEIPESDETTRGRYLWSKVRLSLNSRSHLGKLVKAAYGRELTKEEAEAFDPEALIDIKKPKQIDVMVEQNPSKKDVSVIFNNIISYNKTVKELEPLPIEKEETQTVEKQTSSAVPATAPDAEAEEFTASLENAQKKGEQGKLEDSAQADKTPEEAEAEAAELEAAAIEAKAKAARAKADAAKKKTA